MARKRMIDPGIWTSEDFSNLSMLARLIWVGLISNADDEGRGKANLAYLKSQLFPYDDELSLKKIENSLKEIEKSMSVQFYEVDSKKYYQLLNWRKFQTINKPTASQIPTMPENTAVLLKEVSELSRSIHEEVTEDYGSTTVVVTEDYSPKKEIEYKDKIKKEESIKEERETSSHSAHSQKKIYGYYKNVKLTPDEYSSLISTPDGMQAIEFFSEYREMKGYKCKSDYLAIKKWAFDAVREQRVKQNKEKSFGRQYTREEYDSLIQSPEEVEI